MKRLFVLFLFAATLLTSPLKAEGEEHQYQNWIWFNGAWIYFGNVDPGDPQPVPPGKK